MSRSDSAVPRARLIACGEGAPGGTGSNAQRSSPVRASQARITPPGESTRWLSITIAPCTTRSLITSGGDVMAISLLRTLPMPARRSMAPCAPKSSTGLAGIGVDRHQPPVQGAHENARPAGCAAATVTVAPLRCDPATGPHRGIWRSRTASYTGLAVEHPALLPGLCVHRKRAAQAGAEIQRVVMQHGRGQEGAWRHAGFQLGGVAGVVLPGDFQLIDFSRVISRSGEKRVPPASPPHTGQPPVLPSAHAFSVAHRHAASISNLFIRLIYSASGYCVPDVAAASSLRAGAAPLNRPDASISGAPVGSSRVTLGIPPSTCQAGPLEWEVHTSPCVVHIQFAGVGHQCGQRINRPVAVLGFDSESGCRSAYR